MLLVGMTPLYTANNFFLVDIVCIVLHYFH